jgi:hypothetical protein
VAVRPQRGGGRRCQQQQRGRSEGGGGAAHADLDVVAVEVIQTPLVFLYGESPMKYAKRCLNDFIVQGYI